MDILDPGGIHTDYDQRFLISLSHRSTVFFRVGDIKYNCNALLDGAQILIYK